MEFTAGNCKACDKNVKIERKTLSNILHFFLSIFTGIWFIVWIFLGILSCFEPWSCSTCGSQDVGVN